MILASLLSVFVALAEWPADEQLLLDSMVVL